MILESIHIIAFGGMRNRDFDLSEGVNVFAGNNESGKSSAAMFLKFVFYGLSSRQSRTLGTSERQRWVNRETGQAAGYLTIRTGEGKRYRLERALITSDDGPARERIRIIEQTTGNTVTGQNPGEFFFGMPEDVFVDTCFVSQYLPVKPDIMGGASRGAVENLLTSADENIDVRRAVKKLETGRRELLTRTGGEITELRERRGALLAERNSAADRAAEILSVSASLDDIKKRIAELEVDRERCEKVFRALDAITVKRRIDAAEDARSRKNGLSRAVAELDDAVGESGSPEEAICEAERDIRTYREQRAAFEEQFASIGDESEDSGDLRQIQKEGMPDPSDAVEEVRRTDAAARVQLIAAVASLVSGLIGAAAACFLYSFNIDVYFIPLVVALLLVSLGVAFVALHVKTKERLTRMLKEWNAESAEEIEIAVQERITVLDRERMVSLEKNRLETVLTAAKAKADAAEEKLRTMARAALTEPSDDLDEIIAALHRGVEEQKNERAAMSESIVNLEGRLSVLNEQLTGVDSQQVLAEAEAALKTEEGRYADSLDADGVKQITKEREFTESALKSAMTRRTNLEEKLAELGRLTRTPDELTTEIAALDERIDELTLRHDACEMAKDALTSAGESMRSGVLPRLAENAAELVRGAVQTYDGVALDDNFACSLKTGDEMTPQELLSRGTSDLSYLALRIALTGELFRNEQPPMVLDETFAHIDRSRTEAFMRQLKDRQYLIFTCREEEIAAATAIGDRVILL